ncbi:hypothetical protein Tco_1391011 [Tanacetum coccineum]
MVIWLHLGIRGLTTMAAIQRKLNKPLSYHIISLSQSYTKGGQGRAGRASRWHAITPTASCPATATPTNIITNDGIPIIRVQVPWPQAQQKLTNHDWITFYHIQHRYPPIGSSLNVTTASTEHHTSLLAATKGIVAACYIL